MARQVENMPGRPQTTPTQITAAPLRQPGFNTSFQPAASTKSAESTTYTDKFTELKEKVVEQVRVRMAAAPTKEGQKISIRLNPRFLGNIDISLTVEESSVQAHFLVENNTVRELLQRSHGDLQRTLEEQGIDVESVDIDLSNSESDLGGGGQAFNSIEEQEAARDWLASFHGLGLRGQEQEEERVSNAADPQESDDILNILA